MDKLTFTADCQIQAAADKPPRVSIVAYTGGVMRLAGWGPTVVDLAGMDLAQIPLLADHDNHLGSVAGTGTPRVEANRLIVEGQLAVGTSAANQILALHRSGVRLQASIGAEPVEVRHVKAGKTVTVNGGTHTAPEGGLTFTVKSKLREVSFVAAGADSQTTVSIAAALRRKNPMRPQFDNPFTVAEMDETVRLHYEREAGMRKMRAGLYPVVLGVEAQAEIHATAGGVELESANLREELAWHQARCLAGEITVDQLHSEIAGLTNRDNLLKSLGIAPMPTVRQPREHNNEKILTAAFCLQGGIGKPEEHFDDRTLEAAEHAGRGLTLQTLLMQAACQNGYQSHQGEYVTQGNLRRVLEAAFQPTMRAAGFSTLNISTVLSNTANKMLLDGFNEMPSEWRSIAQVKAVRDFKEHRFIRLLDSLEYEEVGPAGEIKHGTLADDYMTAKALTFAKMLAITRQDIINDDLGALTDVPRRLGRAAAQKFNGMFWAAFTASDSFWSAPNGNVVGTGDERLSEAGLETALKAFRAQKSPAADGAKLIGGKPSILLVPPALEIAARRLLNSAAIITGADATMPAGNPFQGLCTLVVEDRLSTAEGGNDIYWYLLRSPSFAPAMLVPALNGRVEPTVENSEADFNVLGIQFRGYCDVGVARGEKLCGLLLDGSAS